MNDELKPGDHIPNDEAGILKMLDEAFEQGVIVIFGAAGMTVDDIVEATHGHRPGTRLMIIGVPPHTLPGGDLVN